MASAAFDKSSVFRGGIAGITVDVIADGTAVAGSLVKANTFPTIALATADPADWNASGDNYPIGVLKEDPATDIDTAPAAGTVLKMYPLGCGAIVRMEVVTNAGAIEFGQILYANAATGLVTIQTLTATPTADEAVAHHMIAVGKSMEASANDASNTRWIDVLLCR
jgi:hypothetical protein